MKMVGQFPLTDVASFPRSIRLEISLCAYIIAVVHRINRLSNNRHTHTTVIQEVLYYATRITMLFQRISNYFLSLLIK